MKFIYLLRGLPASGKSTFAKRFVQENPGWKRINKDDLRLMFDNVAFDKKNEPFVHKAFEDLVRSALDSNYNVILDNTHLTAASVKQIHKLVEPIGDINVRERCFNVPVEECIRRNALRSGPVPEEVIRRMAKEAWKMENKDTYYPPLVKTPYVADLKLPKAIICDLDGTLALLNGRNPYDASKCEEDLPNKPVLACLKSMYTQGYKIIFMSGRENKYRTQTANFINRHLFEYVADIGSYGWEKITLEYQLYMRPTGDTRKDSIVKRELFDRHVNGKYFVEFVLDDRPSVVRMWRYDLGLTVFQLNDKEF